MTERTIVADEVTCPKCYGTETDFDYPLGNDNEWINKCLRCGTVYKVEEVYKWESTEVQSD